MDFLIWTYYLSAAIVAISAFTNKEATGMKVGKVTLSAIVSTLLIAVIPVVNTIVIIASIYVWLMERSMTKRMAKKTEAPTRVVSMPNEGGKLNRDE